jgi:UDP-2,4-diacetamido-2,4,6-trideoxy-beta-L-altropyranose hydrolase
MNVLFRVDASNLIGTGHLIRCCTLANALRLRGAHICFVTRKHSGHMSKVLACEGFQVKLLPEPIGVGCDTGYAGWLGVSQEEDAKQTIIALKGLVFDLLVVDHYALDSVWERLLREHTSKIMVIDDLANRAHDCDVLLDQNYSLAGSERYLPWVPASCKLLLGPRYALLRPEYAQARKHMLPKAGSIQRVLIYMGGSDIPNMTRIALEALSTNRLHHLEVDVVIGSNFIHRDEVVRLAKSRPNTKVFSQQPHLAALMASADLAIGAGGVTTWERLCMDLPSLVICIADNQIPGTEAMASFELIKYLGIAKHVTVEVIRQAVEQELMAVERIGKQPKHSAIVVDGMGAQRVVEILSPTPTSHLALRHASASDVMTYFMWVNDPTVRSNAIKSSTIDLMTHINWFRRTLAKSDSKLYVLEANGLPVGQVRFERQGETTIIDYSLDQEMRGRGWGRQLIKLGIESLLRDVIGPICLCATVRNGNVVSAAIFERMGFSRGSISGDPDQSCFQLVVPALTGSSFDVNSFGCGLINMNCKKKK